MKEAEIRWISVLERELETELKAPSAVSSHDVSHVRRVWKNAKEIAAGMKVDWEVLVAAAYLHDVGRHRAESIVEHGSVSARFARKVLEQAGFPKEKIDAVADAIAFHDESYPPSKRNTLEAKVLYDADKLDVFGAIGVARFLVFFSSRGMTIDQIAAYALENMPKRFEGIEIAKELAKERYDYTMGYFKKLRQELG